MAEQHFLTVLASIHNRAAVSRKGLLKLQQINEARLLLRRQAQAATADLHSTCCRRALEEGHVDDKAGLHSEGAALIGSHVAHAKLQGIWEYCFQLQQVLPLQQNR